MKPALIFALLVSSLLLTNLAFAEPGTASVEVNGVNYEVSYDATGLTVDGMEADTLTSTLTVFVATTDVSSTLEITLERSFLDSRANGDDESFVVLADFDEAIFTEEATDTVRTLTITVPSGTSSIDIIGTAFGAQIEEAPVEEEPEPETPEEAPEETSEETPEEAPEETEPTPQCGPGTILKDGVCVLDETEPQEEPEVPVETAEEPQRQCGPGTTLKDGVCVLDETCGPGTILKDGQCVLDERESKPSRGLAFEFVVPIVAAFVIAFIVMMILWAIGKASRKKSA
ncbi:MAG: hypothetical protein WAO91_00735 [Candidatus Nitrosotenuis sp.]